MLAKILAGAQSGANVAVWISRGRNNTEMVWEYRKRTESRTFTGAEEYCWRLACESVEIRNGQSPRATFEKRSKGRPTCVSVLGSGRAAPSSAFFDFGLCAATGTSQPANLSSSSNSTQSALRCLATVTDGAVFTSRSLSLHTSYVDLNQIA